MSLDRAPLILNSDGDMESGGKEHDSISDDFSYRNNVANAAVNIRLGFLRKVYSLLAIQLLFTVAVSITFMTIDPVKSYVQTNDWLLITGFFANIIILIALFCKRKDHPANLYLLAAFTVIESYTVAVVVTMYDHIVVLEAFILTFAVVMGLTAFTMQTKKDFSSMGAGLYAGLCVLLVGGFLHLIFGGTTFNLLLSIGGSLLFSLFIIYDTQLIMKTLSAEEYILATINLYMDIINLFLYILRALQATRQ